MAAKSTADDAAPGNKKKKMIIVGGLAAVLLLGGGIGGTYMMVKPASAATETVEETLEPGEVVALDPISVNLPDGHYLKVGIALQTVLDESGGEGSSAPDGSKALDLTIKEFSGVPMTDLSNAELRQKYQDELQAKIIEAYTKEPAKEGEAPTKTVMGIYLTSFVMQ